MAAPSLFDGHRKGRLQCEKCATRARTAESACVRINRGFARFAESPLGAMAAHALPAGSRPRHRPEPPQKVDELETCG